MNDFIKIPKPLMADIYTVCSRDIVSNSAKHKSVYNFTNRTSPKNAWPNIATDSRMVFFGLRYFIENYLNEPIYQWEIDETKNFLKDAESFGKSLPFDEDMWQSIVGKKLPIKIEALKEGSTFFPNEPVIQVQNTLPGYGEIAAHIEANLVGIISHASALATLNRHWLANLQQWLYQSIDDEKLEISARFLLHDFGMRACCGSEHSAITGLANLLSFYGTDTSNAAYIAWKWGAKRPTGTSIPALAHRIIQGHNSENECFEQLALSSDFASYVADCYNFENAVVNHLVKLAEKYKNKTVVIRPDSGDYIENVIFIIQQAIKTNQYIRQSNDIIKPTNIKFIQGDSMNPRKIDYIYKALRRHNFSIDWGIFGVGGWRINNVNRDILSSSYKLSSVDGRPTCKLSETSVKISIPGPNKISRKEENTVYFEDEIDNSEYHTYYDNDILPCSNFYEVQERNIQDFYANYFRIENNPNFGLDGSCLSDKIIEFRKTQFLHRKR